MISNKFVMWLFALFMLFGLSGCADMVTQITLTHIRTYKVADGTPLPTSDEAQSVTLTKQLDIDVVKVVQDIIDVTSAIVGKVIGLGDALFKGAAAIIVEGQPVNRTVTPSGST